MNFHPDKQLFKLLTPGIEPLTLGLQGQSSTPKPQGLTEEEVFKKLIH